MIKNFLPPKLKYGSSRCFSPVLCGFERCGSTAFRIFAGIFSEKCVRPIQEYCTNEKSRSVSQLRCSVTTCIQSSGQKRIGDFAKYGSSRCFSEMLSLIERGKADGIISWHPDRLARNSVDGGKIIHFVDRGLIKSPNFPLFGLNRHRKGCLC